MTLRNIGIVFSPTLGIPAGIFSEMVTHFGAIFDDEDVEPSGATADLSSIAESTDEQDGTVTRKRNSMLYQAGGADALLGLGGRSLDPGEWHGPHATPPDSSQLLRTRRQSCLLMARETRRLLPCTRKKAYRAVYKLLELKHIRRRPRSGNQKQHLERRIADWPLRRLAHPIMAGEAPQTAHIQACLSAQDHRDQRASLPR